MSGNRRLAAPGRSCQSNDEDFFVDRSLSHMDIFTQPLNFF